MQHVKGFLFMLNLGFLYILPLVWLWLAYYIFTLMSFPFNFICLLGFYYMCTYTIDADDTLRKKCLRYIDCGETGIGSVKVSGLDQISGDVMKKSIIIIHPHGPTATIPPCLCPIINRVFNLTTVVFVAKNFLRIPLIRYVYTLYATFTYVDPKQIEHILNTVPKPAMIYPGGFPEVFANSKHPDKLNIIVNPKSKLYEIAKTSNRYLIPLLVLNETDVYNHPKLATRFFDWLYNHGIRIGIPTPYLGQYGIPCWSSDKTINLAIGIPIDTSKLTSQEIHEEVIKQIEDLHCKHECSKPLNIQTR
jgi:hypothetical protein